MNPTEATSLLTGAIPRATATWADVGAGAGTFTRALASFLAPGSRIYAVDRDARALGKLTKGALGQGIELVTVIADFTTGFDLPAVPSSGLDGILIANALHFVKETGRVVKQLARLIRTGGRLVVIEYDGRPASRWVPFPLSPAKLAELAIAANLGAPAVIATKPSAFGGLMYVAVLEREERG